MTDLQAEQQLLTTSRADADRWIGAHADALAEVAYAVSRSGASFDGVSVNVLLHEADNDRAIDLLPELRSGLSSIEYSSELFICVRMSRTRYATTHDVRFFIERTTPLREELP